MPEKSPVPKNIPENTLRNIYLSMVRIRRLEERIAEMVGDGEIVCPCHLYIGQEAIAAGVGAALKKEDWVFSTHRSHGHYLAKGGEMNTLMAELLGKSAGCSHGRGGSMHLASPEIGLPGSSAIVAGTIPLAVGAALAFTIRRQNNVSVAFFGDGAFGEGVLYESLNFAALRKLPVIFVCENNLYSTHMPIADSLAETAIYKKAAMFAMPGVKVDGNDAVAVYSAAREAVLRARRGHGPTLIECRTYRWRGHVGPNYDIDKGLRSQKELERWMKQCPIKKLEKQLVTGGIITPAEKKCLEETVVREVDEALRFARQCPYPAPGEVASRVFKD